MKGQSSAKPTIIEVAERAGVSIATVSRVLNRTGRYNEETSKRIRAIADAMGYAPNHLAKSLRQARTGQIALAIADVGNPVYVAMAKSVQQVAKERGYRLVLLSTEALVDEEVGILRSLAKRYVDGLIISPLKYGEQHREELRKVRAPVVMIGGGSGQAEVDSVVVDSSHGVRLVMEHLLGQGYTKIALVNGPEGTVPATARLKGYRATHIEHNLAIDDSLIFTSDFTLSGGYEVGEAILRSPARPDAVFCANDLMALGVMRRLKEVGIRVPGDVAVVGMDDIEHAAVASPALTTVSLLASERGRIAAELLFERLQDEEGWQTAPAKTITVKPRLVVRESSILAFVNERHSSHPEAL